METKTFYEVLEEKNFKFSEELGVEIGINAALEYIEYADFEDEGLYNVLDYSGAIDEAIDGRIDIYYGDLREWAAKDGNWQYVEQAQDDGLTDTSKADYHKDIQAGQYVMLQEQANEYIEEIEKFLLEYDNPIYKMSDDLVKELLEGEGEN